MKCAPLDAESMDAVLVSVIVPVHDTPHKPLTRCIDSVRAQTYQNFELLIVDDGSCEGVAQDIDSLVEGFAGARVIHQDNQGVSKARNVGIEASKGEFIAFIDADDTVSKTYLEEALELMTAHNLDLVCGGMELVYSNATRRASINTNSDIILYGKNDIAPVIEHCISFKSIPSHPELNQTEISGPCAKLYRRVLLENTRFEEDMHLYEDIIFSVQTFLDSRTTGVANSIWYQYYQESSSASNSFQLSLLYDSIKYIAWLTAAISNRLPDSLPWVYRTSVIWLNNYLNNVVGFNIPNAKENISMILDDPLWSANISAALKAHILTFKESVSARMATRSMIGTMILLAKLNRSLKHKGEKQDDLFLHDVSGEC